MTNDQQIAKLRQEYAKTYSELEAKIEVDALSDEGHKNYEAFLALAKEIEARMEAVGLSRRSYKGSQGGKDSYAWRRITSTNFNLRVLKGEKQARLKASLRAQNREQGRMVRMTTYF